MIASSYLRPFQFLSLIYFVCSGSIATDPFSANFEQCPVRSVATEMLQRRE
jgi:hypothetical protein